MVTFTALAKVFSMSFYNTKVAGLGKILSSKNFHVYGILDIVHLSVQVGGRYIKISPSPACTKILFLIVAAITNTVEVVLLVEVTFQYNNTITVVTTLNLTYHFMNN